MKAAQVFTPGKEPSITYIDDHLKEKSTQLIDGLEEGASVVSLSGPSKSGKTVFIEKHVSKDNLIQITGAGVENSSILWGRVFDIIGTPVNKKVSSKKTYSGATATKVGGGPIVVKAEISNTDTEGRESAKEEIFSVDYLQLLIRELSGTDFVVFIDDFHYIPKVAQGEIANQIKEAIRNGVKIICASVPYRSDDAIRANPDLRGRTIKIDFNYWNIGELSKIAKRGFEALNVRASEGVVLALASEAAGSPQLMQALCLHSCYEADFREKQEIVRDLPNTPEFIKKVCNRTSSTVDYSTTVNKMKDGPKTRGQDRKTYVLKDGGCFDVYPLILKAIAANPPGLTIRYGDLQNRIQALCGPEIPSGSSVTGACAHIAAIANDSENMNIIEWDGESDVLDIRDPYLLFTLRWDE